MTLKRKSKRKGPGRPKGPVRKTISVSLTPETLAKIGARPAIKIRRVIERLLRFE